MTLSLCKQLIPRLSFVNYSRHFRMCLRGVSTLFLEKQKFARAQCSYFLEFHPQIVFILLLLTMFSVGFKTAIFCFFALVINYSAVIKVLLLVSANNKYNLSFELQISCKKISLVSPRKAWAKTDFCKQPFDLLKPLPSKIMNVPVWFETGLTAL